MDTVLKVLARLYDLGDEFQCQGTCASFQLEEDDLRSHVRAVTITS
jgi:hypothetical protein